MREYPGVTSTLQFPMIYGFELVLLRVISELPGEYALARGNKLFVIRGIALIATMFGVLSLGISYTFDVKFKREVVYSGPVADGAVLTDIGDDGTFIGSVGTGTKTAAIFRSSTPTLIGAQGLAANYPDNVAAHINRFGEILIVSATGHSVVNNGAAWTEIGRAANQTVCDLNDLHESLGISNAGFCFNQDHLSLIHISAQDATQALNAHLSEVGLFGGTVLVGTESRTAWFDGNSLQILSAGPYGQSAMTDMNAFGQASGYAIDANGSEFPAMWIDGQYRSLLLPPSVSTGRCNGLQDGTLAVGYGMQNGVPIPIVWDFNGRAYSSSGFLGIPANITNAKAVAVNSVGEFGLVITQNNGTQSFERITPIPILGVQVSLQDYLPSVNGTYASFWIVDRATQQVILSGRKAVNSSGIFRRNVALPSGTWDVVVKVDGFLSKRGTITSNNRGFETLPVSLMNGDIDLDNEVGPSDFGILSSAFRARPGNPRYDRNADLNKDNSVDESDLNILMANYGEVGE